jgi:hypothetical protein
MQKLCVKIAYFWNSRLNKIFIMATITADAATARERLHHIIDEIEDTRVINLYEFLKDEDNTVEDFVYTGEVKARIAKVRDDYANGRKESFLTGKQFRDQLKQLRSGK